MLDSTELLSELRSELRSRFLEREASVRDEILAQCKNGAHVQGDAQEAQAAERATHELDFAVQQMSQTLEDAQKEAARLRGQHALLIRASRAAALASAASLAAARSEMDSLRAEVEEYKSLAQALTQDCELYKEQYVQAEWKRHLAEQAAANTKRNEECLHIELAQCRQESNRKQKALEAAQGQASILRRVLADVLGQAAQVLPDALMHEFLSSQCERNIDQLLLCGASARQLDTTSGGKDPEEDTHERMDSTGMSHGCSSLSRA